MLGEIAQENIARRVNRTFTALCIADIQITAQLRRIAGKRDDIAVTMVVDAVRELRHAFADEIRQLCKVIDIGGHDGVSKFMRQRSVKVAGGTVIALAVDIIRRQRAVISHVDLHGERGSLAAL